MSEPSKISTNNIQVSRSQSDRVKAVPELMDGYASVLFGGTSKHFPTSLLYDLRARGNKVTVRKGKTMDSLEVDNGRSVYEYYFEDPDRDENRADEIRKRHNEMLSDIKKKFL